MFEFRIFICDAYSIFHLQVVYVEAPPTPAVEYGPPAVEQSVYVQTPVAPVIETVPNCLHEPLVQSLPAIDISSNFGFGAWPQSVPSIGDHQNLVLQYIPQQAQQYIPQPLQHYVPQFALPFQAPLVHPSFIPQSQLYVPPSVAVESKLPSVDIPATFQVPSHPYPAPVVLESKPYPPALPVVESKPYAAAGPISHYGDPIVLLN